MNKRILKKRKKRLEYLLKAFLVYRLRYVVIETDRQFYKATGYSPLYTDIKEQWLKENTVKLKYSFEVWEKRNRNYIKKYIK
jgi:hypothetical protein